MERSGLTAGVRGEETRFVQQDDTAAAYGSGLLAVFATPALIALMEHTAAMSVEALLPDGHTSVGTHVDVRHVAATPVGMTVRCVSELVGVEGRKLTFAVTAYDDAGLIGEGTHVRAIVEKQRFMERVNGKLAREDGGKV